jgi:hypothetical protein
MIGAAIHDDTLKALVSQHVIRGMGWSAGWPAITSARPCRCASVAPRRG